MAVWGRSERKEAQAGRIFRSKAAQECPRILPESPHNVSGTLLYFLMLSWIAPSFLTTGWLLKSVNILAPSVLSPSRQAYTIRLFVSAWLLPSSVKKEIPLFFGVVFLCQQRLHFLVVSYTVKTEEILGGHLGFCRSVTKGGPRKSRSCLWEGSQMAGRK